MSKNQTTTKARAKTGSNVNEKSGSLLPISGVMLANKYEESKHGAKLSTSVWWMSEKLDGLRAVNVYYNCEVVILIYASFVLVLVRGYYSCISYLSIPLLLLIVCTLLFPLLALILCYIALLI